ncbi:unnamed protein product [Darwinula stevensoni]|uniref:Uncharacterized protein n=1 Tax=Darwinula stevensoni TaxID=69355 RepID=A0A7R8XBT6_9CRUS|nr:unnamed protein product [Darwinula stevensoni]CAG0887002.1 unnamed protein product [Darwinula stevensoni]
MSFVWERRQTTPIAVCARRLGKESSARRRAFNRFARLKSGNYSVENKLRSERPSELDDESLLQLMEADPRMTTRPMAAVLECSHSTIAHLLSTIGKVSKLGSWILLALTQKDLDQRILKTHTSGENGEEDMLWSFDLDDWKHGCWCIMAEFDKAVIGAMCYFSTMIIIDSILIYGIRVRKRTLMIPWLCVVALQLTAALIIFIIFIVGAIQRKTDAGPLLLVSFLFFAPFFMATSLYKVVYTYFKDLRNQMQSGQTFQIVLPSPTQPHPHAQGGFQPLGVQYLPPTFGKSQPGGIQYAQPPQEEFQHMTIPRAHVNAQMGME